MDPSDSSEEYIKHISKVFQERSVPTITNAYILSEADDGECIIGTNWKQNSYENNKSNNFVTLSNIKSNRRDLIKVPCFPINCESVVLESVSDSLKHKAVIKKQENAQSKNEEFILEVWSNLHMKVLKTINLSVFKKHGKVHSDAVFSSLKWSKNEEKLLYIAEKKKENITGFFENVITLSTDNKETIRGLKYEYEESWGELLSDVTNPVICIVNWENETVDVVSDIPEHISPAQPQWGPNDSLIFEGIQTKPFRLGRIYCENRVSSIFHIKFEGDGNVVDETKVNSDSLSMNSNPRISNCGTKFIFLHRLLSGKGDPHRASEVLMMYKFEDKSLSKVYDEEMSVPLFAHALPQNCWLQDNTNIAVPNTISGQSYVCIINTESCQIQGMVRCTSVFTVYKDLILTSYMKLYSELASLQIVAFTDSVISIVGKIEKNLKEIEYNTITDQHGMVSHYIIPANGFPEKIPLVVYPHGGPHSVYTDNFNKNSQIFCQLGYAVLLVNYRGSTGFTDDLLRSLPGNIGVQDVQDVHNFSLQFIESKKDLIDVCNVFVYGGSHGGFLGAHLIGQYPDFYRAAVLINPVIEVASMSLVSDIPDWDYYEAGIPYTQNIIPNSDAYKSMLEKSPIIHVDRIKAPVLLCIGRKDLRVPPSQGKAYFKLLKANDKVVKMLLYPMDSHPLSSVETEGDFFVNACKWFHEHQQK